MSIIPALSATDIANFRAMERDVTLQTGRTADVAGGTLTVRRIPDAANERTERPEPAVVGTVAGYVYRSQRQQIVAGAADFTPVDTWQFVSEIDTWQAGRAYQVGNVVVPNEANGHRYVVTVAGVSGATEPVWPTGAAATVADGTVTWAEAGPHILENDEVVSVATPALAWQVMGVEPHAGYVMATLEAL